MADQTVRNVHVNAPLSNLARRYRPQGFIADEVCPRLPVAKESDLYYVWDQGALNRADVDDLVSDRAEARHIEFAHSTEQYTAEKRALAFSVTDREVANADAVLNLQSNKQQSTLDSLALKREIRVATMLKKTSNGGSLALGAGAAAKWDNASSDYQDIVTDIVLGITAMRQAIGVRPNVIVVPSLVAEGAHKSLLFQFMQYTSGESLLSGPSILPASILGMRVLTPGGIYNSAKEGQTASNTDVWGESVRLLYVTNGPALDNPSVAYTFEARPLTTREWRDDPKEMDVFEVGNVIAEKVTAPSAGYEIADCLT